MTATWSALFERGGEYEVTVEAIREELTRRRQTESEADDV